MMYHIEAEKATRLKLQATAGCQIGAREGCLWVSLSVPSVLSVYAWDGHRILSGRYEAGEQTFRLPSGIYVVRIGEYVQKVRIHN